MDDMLMIAGGIKTVQEMQSDNKIRVPTAGELWEIHMRHSRGPNNRLPKFPNGLRAHSDGNADDPQPGIELWGAGGDEHWAKANEEIRPCNSLSLPGDQDRAHSGP